MHGLATRTEHLLEIVWPIQGYMWFLKGKIWDVSCNTQNVYIMYSPFDCQIKLLRWIWRVSEKHVQLYFCAIKTFNQGGKMRRVFWFLPPFHLAWKRDFKGSVYVCLYVCYRLSTARNLKLDQIGVNQRSRSILEWRSRRYYHIPLELRGQKGWRKMWKKPPRDLKKEKKIQWSQKRTLPCR